MLSRKFELGWMSWDLGPLGALNFEKDISQYSFMCVLSLEQQTDGTDRTDGYVWACMGR